MKISNLLRPILLIFLILVLVLPNFSVSAQMSPKEERAALERELKELEEKIRQYEIDITKAEAGKQTLRYQINTLKNRIGQLDLQIRRSNIIIQDLGLQIKDTEGSIEKTSLKIDDLRGKLTTILRTIYEEDRTSIVEILFSGATLSDFFDSLMALESLNLKSQEFLGEIKAFKTTLEGQKESLDSEKSNLERVVRVQYAQIQQSRAARSEQEKLLLMTKAQYQQYLKEKETAEKSAAEIRARLFRLIGIPDIQAPDFGEVLEIAQAVTRVVNIRPAFLLGVISAESALGRNVGQCYITNRETGGGACISDVRGLCQAGDPLNRIMHSTRDLPIFLRMTGDNFNQVPVSCWIPICAKGIHPKYQFVYNNIKIDSAGNIICPSGYVPFGFGGAMGPAQFIPSTWADRLYKLEPLVQGTPNPWNVNHAFLASALYLRDLGGQTNERRAAHRYSGGYSWYASDVMRRASCIQEFIDKRTMSSACEQLIF